MTSMSCNDRVLDMFVTKDSTNYSSEFDDQFVAPVWSVEFDTANTIAVVNKQSVWVAVCKRYRVTSGPITVPVAGSYNEISYITSANLSLDPLIGDELAYSPPSLQTFTVIGTITGTSQVGGLTVISFTPPLPETIPQFAFFKVVPKTDTDNIELDEGDLVRIGQVATAGYTDYMTIVEKRPITGIKSAVEVGGQVVKLDIIEPDASATHRLAADIDNAVNPSLMASITDYNIPDGAAGSFSITNGVLTPSSTPGTGMWSVGIHPYAYRLNFNVNVTKPTLNHVLSGTTPSSNGFHFHVTGTNETTLLFQERHRLRHSPYSSISPDEKCFYPLYKVKKWLTNNGEISIALDHGVKSLRWMKLIAYSVFNKRQVGFQNAHEVTSDDWVALRINEVEGKVVSNNQTANGAFAVLHVGGTSDNTSGAIEYHTHDPNGLFTHYFDNHMSTIRNLNLKLLDRKGDAAHFGRIHLWFKVCVQHG